MNPLNIPDSRICVLRHANEVTICANIAGFQAIGQWIAWLAQSNPEENFHFHLLWHLESEASRFEGVLPKNVWVLLESNQEKVARDEKRFELTFQVVCDDDLDELATHQTTGLMPRRFQKNEGPSEAFKN